MNEIEERKNGEAKRGMTLPPAASAPENPPSVAVRQYAMSADGRKRWLRNHPEEAERVKLRVPETEDKKQLEQQLRSKIRRIGFVGAILVLLLVLVAVIQLTSALFVVKQISVTGTDRYSAAELAASAGFGEGARMRSLSRKDAQKAILDRYPEFSECIVETGFNGEVTIRVTERQPVLYFALGGKYYAVTETLYVTEEADTPSAFTEKNLLYVELPGIAAAVTGEKLEFLSGTGDFITEFLQAADEKDLLNRLQTVSFENRYSIISTADDGSVTQYGSVEDIERKLLIAERVRENNPGADSALRIDVSEPDAVLVDEMK